MMTTAMSVAVPNDTELVSKSLTGNRDAFGQIVARYQSLVWSLAYSATGSLSRSEDLAQETFVTAWRQLSTLREPENLRSWLCRIARNLTCDELRQQGREPSHEAAGLEEISESPAPGPQPAEQTISNEESAILWRSLERIPEIYREPLVLFYREHQSIAAVAQSLDLTEDAVKQRLSRGRKMLHEQVLAFVEVALEKTSPGKNFTLGVIAALPVAVTTAKAATVGAAIAKGGAAAKSVATVTSLGGLFAMIGGAYITLRAQADDTKSPRERQFILQMIGIRLFTLLLFLAICFATRTVDYPHGPIGSEFSRPVYIYLISIVGTMLFAYSSSRQQQIQIEDNTFVAAEWTTPRKSTNGSRSNKHIKSAKFMALALVVSVVMIAQAPWQQHFGQAVLWSATWLLLLLWSYHAWQNRPRYQSLRSGWVVIAPVLMGLMTLFIFNLHQYQAQTGSNDSPLASPAEIFTFNLVVVLAYAAFIGILVWKRRTILC